MHQPETTVSDRDATSVDARPIYRSTAGWAVSVLRDLGAICERHDTGDVLVVHDTDAWQRAREFARHYPFQNSSVEACLTAIDDVWAYTLSHQAHRRGE